VIKRLLLTAAFMAAFLMPAHGRMFPSQFEIKSVCWSDFDEAVRYHQEILGEYPIGKGWINSKSGPAFGAVMYNPTKPSWTFLSFHQNESGVIVCAITGGSQWDVITPGSDEEKLAL
jgi:hypothetical protein